MKKETQKQQVSMKVNQANLITKVSEFILPSNKAYRHCFIKPQAEASSGQVR